MDNYDQAVGFWSYTHRDEELSRGRIRKLAQCIADEFEAITAERLQIFVDKEDLEWGAEWRSRIDAALAGTTLFIPIVTPAFFKSAECRKELLTFSGHAKSLDLEELVLPILYIKVVGLVEGSPDEVMSLVAKRQYVDWTALRLEDDDSPEHRKAVAGLAQRLVDILERSAKVASENERSIEFSSTDEPTLIETMAEMESAFPRWTKVVEEFSSVMEIIGSEAKEATAEINKSDTQGKGFAGRLRVSHQLAERISEPVHRFSELGNEYSTELVNVDPGILTLIREASKKELEPTEKALASEFFSHIKSAVVASRANGPTLREFSQSVRELRGLSKAIRPLADMMRSAIQQVLDGQAILDEWERLIDEATG
jgi:TIR domain